MSRSSDIVRIDQEIVFQGAVIAIRQDVIVYADGTERVNQILQVPEGVLVLPINESGRLLLTQEFRHNHGKIFGVPMGKVDLGEAPLTAARRELLEEVGLQALTFTHLSTHHNGVHEEGLNHYFLAEGLSYGNSAPEEDEEIELLELTFEEAFAVMRESETKFVDLRSRGCIWAAYAYLHSHRK